MRRAHLPIRTVFLPPRNESLRSSALWVEEHCVGEHCLDVLTPTAFRLQRGCNGRGERQFVGEQQVVGLIAGGAGWREGAPLGAETRLLRHG